MGRRKVQQSKKNHSHGHKKTYFSKNDLHIQQRSSAKNHNQENLVDIHPTGKREKYEIPKDPLTEQYVAANDSAYEFPPIIIVFIVIGVLMLFFYLLF